VKDRVNTALITRNREFKGMITNLIDYTKRSLVLIISNSSEV